MLSLTNNVYLKRRGLSNASSEKEPDDILTLNGWEPYGGFIPTRPEPYVYLTTERGYEIAIPETTSIMNDTESSTKASALKVGYPVALMVGWKPPLTTHIMAKQGRRVGYAMQTDSQWQPQRMMYSDSIIGQMIAGAIESTGSITYRALPRITFKRLQESNLTGMQMMLLRLGVLANLKDETLIVEGFPDVLRLIQEARLKDKTSRRIITSGLDFEIEPAPYRIDQDVIVHLSPMDKKLNFIQRDSNHQYLSRGFVVHE